MIACQSRVTVPGWRALASALVASVPRTLHDAHDRNQHWRAHELMTLEQTLEQQALDQPFEQIFQKPQVERKVEISNSSLPGGIENLKSAISARDPFFEG